MKVTKAEYDVLDTLFNEVRDQLSYEPNSELREAFAKYQKLLQGIEVVPEETWMQ